MGRVPLPFTPWGGVDYSQLGRATWVSGPHRCSILQDHRHSRERNIQIGGTVSENRPFFHSSPANNCQPRTCRSCHLPDKSLAEQLFPTPLLSPSPWRPLYPNLCDISVCSMTGSSCIIRTPSGACRGCLVTSDARRESSPQLFLAPASLDFTTPRLRGFFGQVSDATDAFTLDVVPWTNARGQPEVRPAYPSMSSASASCGWASRVSSF